MPGDASPDAPRFLDSGVAGMVNTAQESMSPGGSHKPLIDVSRAVSGETTFISIILDVANCSMVTMVIMVT
jgi:hypothetical protein